MAVLLSGGIEGGNVWHGQPICAVAVQSIIPICTHSWARVHDAAAVHMAGADMMAWDGHQEVKVTLVGPSRQAKSY